MPEAFMEWELLANLDVRFHCPCGSRILQGSFLRHVATARHRAWEQSSGRFVRAVTYTGYNVDP
jgi:hypothetical protein